MRKLAPALMALFLVAPASATVNLITAGGFAASPAQIGGGSPIAGAADRDTAAEIGPFYTLRFWVGQANDQATPRPRADEAMLRPSIGRGPATDLANAEAVANGLGWKRFVTSYAATAAASRRPPLSATL